MRKIGSFSRVTVGFMVNIQRKGGNGFKLVRVWFEKGNTNKKTEAIMPRFFCGKSTFLSSAAE
jgi:hypothetical protein